MKLLNIIPVFAVALVAASCSGGAKSPENSLSQYALTPEESSRTAPRQGDDDIPVRLPPVTSQGVGPLRLGMAPSAVPRALLGVWDSVATDTQVWDDEAFAIMEFYLHGEKTIEALAMSDTARIDGITITTPLLRLNVDGQQVGVGTSQSVLRRLKGLNALPDGEGGMPRWEWHGVTIYVDADSVAALALG